MTHQISPSDLAGLMAANAVKVVDGSWALDGSDMRAAFLEDHIPGAVFFDLEAISDHSSALPHMVPTPEHFAEAVGRLGISDTDRVVVYDRQGLFSAARVWWTFRLMGHEHVQVLAGGLPAWKSEGRLTTHDISELISVRYSTQLNANLAANIDDVTESLAEKSTVVLDARPAARFSGQAAEPRAGLRSGHMPGALSLPASELIQNGALRPLLELRQRFEALGVGPDIPVITSCGSGVTAAILSLALAELGHTESKLYDGSWAEWGQSTLDTPVVTGEAPATSDK